MGLGSGEWSLRWEGTWWGRGREYVKNFHLTFLIIKFHICVKCVTHMWQSSPYVIGPYVIWCVTYRWNSFTYVWMSRVHILTSLTSVMSFHSYVNIITYLWIHSQICESQLCDYIHIYVNIFIDIHMDVTYEFTLVWTGIHIKVKWKWIHIDVNPWSKNHTNVNL